MVQVLKIVKYYYIVSKLDYYWTDYKATLFQAVLLNLNQKQGSVYQKFYLPFKGKKNPERNSSISIKFGEFFYFVRIHI